MDIARSDMERDGAVESAGGAHELLVTGRIAHRAHLEWFEIKTKAVQKCV
jgi:hypothetical protein